MYCTAGVRCERASAFMRNKGVQNVYQLEGGIHRYLDAYPDDGGYWIGKNYVFDKVKERFLPALRHLHHLLYHHLRRCSPHNTPMPATSTHTSLVFSHPHRGSSLRSGSLTEPVAPPWRRYRRACFAASRGPATRRRRAAAAAAWRYAKE